MAAIPNSSVTSANTWELEFIENNPMLDTEEEISVEENGASTIEVYKDNKIIWENGKY